jgi:hypothetical protein
MADSNFPIPESFHFAANKHFQTGVKKLRSAADNIRADANTDNYNRRGANGTAQTRSACKGIR